MVVLRLRCQGVGGGQVAEVTSREFLVERGEERMDVFLAGQRTGLTRSQVRRLTKEGYVVLNGGVTKSSRKLRKGDRISLTVPPPNPHGTCTGAHAATRRFSGRGNAGHRQARGPYGTPCSRASRPYPGERAAGPLPRSDGHRRRYTPRNRPQGWIKTPQV